MLVILNIPKCNTVPQSLSDTWSLPTFFLSVFFLMLLYQHI